VEILEARVRWMPEFDNHPEFEILVDEIPKIEELVYTEIKLGKDAFYYAEKDGYVHYIYHQPLDETGFGGRVFRLNVKNDWGQIEAKDLKGPWASRAAVVNALVKHIECVDVALTDKPESYERGHTFTAGTITLERATKAAKKAGVILEESIMRRGQEIIWVPRKKADLRGGISYNLPPEIQTITQLCRGLMGTIDLQNYMIGGDEGYRPAFNSWYNGVKYLRKYYGRQWQDIISRDGTEHVEKVIIHKTEEQFER